jgi:hypothetical protein
VVIVVSKFETKAENWVFAGVGCEGMEVKYISGSAED